mmetsp:Transcript_43100/g.85555  ORF Transcript_43100/g.85555 Transcript_43100/m.85555 type:complete len:249 (+) Transcript_43100:54-800(+)
MSKFTDKTISSVLILIAMEAEAKPLLDSLQLAKVNSKVPFAPFHIFSGDYKGTNVTLVTNGKDARFNVDNVGTTSGALSAFYAINEVKPDLVINAGTAGGFKRVGAAIGDAFITTTCAHHDRRIPIPGFTEYGIGNHSSVPCKNLVETLGFKSGPCTTSNSLDHCDMDDKLMLENGASVKDMEAAAIAYVAELASVPFFGLKVVTDIVDGDRPTQEEFFENLAAASASLQEKIPKVLDFVVGRKISDL